MPTSLSDYDTTPIPTVKTPQTPPPLAIGEQASIVEQAIHRLSEAAQCITAAESGHVRIPRVSRLKPLRDISADIQRTSTPLPTLADSENVASQQSNDLGQRMPDLWPWLQGDSEENEAAQWPNYTDPLLSRRIPSRGDAARIEEADTQRAIADGLLVSSSRRKRSRLNRLRLAFICLSILAVIALGVDSLLLSVAFLHTSRSVGKVNGPPTLTISLRGQSQLSNVVTIGQSIDLRLRNFTPSSFVFLTHDVGQLVQTDLGTPLVRVDQNGNADVTAVVDDSWGPGFHTIQAEDRTTHYTASATIQITLASTGHTSPSHLQVIPGELDMGQAPQGANTIRQLTLSNEGTGSLTWSANSSQPWLLLTPNQGTFSKSQTVVVGVQRTSLKPGNYRGKITFTSSVGNHVDVMITMTVQPLSTNTPVLEVTPAVLSFTALDGDPAPNPDTQYLLINNPGSQPLTWSLSDDTPTSLSGQGTSFGAMDQSPNWLSLSQSSGTVVAGSTTSIGVVVHSQHLLPGTYINTLVFSGAAGTTDSPQSVTISLTIQPSCGLTLNTGGMSFTAVVGQGNPSNQALSLGITPSCPNGVNWQASTSASWLSVTPNSGKITAGTPNTVMTVGVDTQGLHTGTLTGTISLVTGQNSQTVLVTLTMQAPLPPSAPVMGISQLSLNFSTTQGQSSPPGQSVTITNTASPGGSTLSWHVSVGTLASSWLGASPASGTITAGQTGQLAVNVDTSGLTPGTYVGQVMIIGTDSSGTQSAGGSPQTITVNLLVLPPCALAQPSSSALAFTALQGSSSPAPQSLNLTASGNCGWPLHWQVSVPSTASWLSISPMSGQLSTSGQSTTLVVSPVAAGLAPGTYSASVSVTAIDASNTPAQGSPQVFAVTLTVSQPCTLQVSPASGISMTAAQGQVPPAKTLSLSDVGSCAFPVSWTASGDSNSANWLTLSATSGTDSGNGSSISVGVNSAATLIPGTYHGVITITASGTGGASVQSSPQTIPVVLKITGFTISGVVEACADTTCASPTPLPSAALNLVNSSGTTIATIQANSTGNFSFIDVPLGSYTISASGTDSSGTPYTGSLGVTVSKNTSGLMVNVSEPAQ
jgi:hypothetical protein